MPEDFNPGGFGACYVPAGRAGMDVRVSFGPRWSFRAGAPYSALVVTVEAPPPGSAPQQSHPQSRMNWRDSAGRVRLEMQGQTINGDCPNILVQIEDPVAGYAYVLDTLDKIAHRIPVHFVPQGDPRPLPAPRTLRDGETVVTESIGTQSVSGLSVTRTQQTKTCPNGFVHDSKPNPVTPEWQAARPRGECLPEPLPGVMAPAADISEHWSSPELHMSVFAKYTDHKGNTSTTTLQNLQLTDPDPALFQIPAGYRIVDEPDARVVTFTIPLPPQN